MRKEKILRIIGKVLIIGFVLEAILNSIEAAKENNRLRESIERSESYSLRLQNLVEQSELRLLRLKNLAA